MRPSRSSLALPIALALALGACENKPSSSSSPTSSAAPSASSAAPVASASSTPAPSASAAKQTRFVGISGPIFAAAHEINLTAVDKVKVNDAEAMLQSGDDAVMDAASKALREDIVAGLRAGAIDMKKVQSHYATMDAATEAQRSREANALDALHAVLPPVDRHNLVATVRAKQAERDAQMATHAPPPMSDAGAAEWQKRRLAQMTADLGLDAGQQKQVAAMLAKEKPPSFATFDARHVELKKKLEALLTAFDADQFQSKDVDLALMTPEQAHEAMDREVRLFAQLAPVLKPEQRERLAAEVQKRARFGRVGMRAVGGHEGGGAD